MIRLAQHQIIAGLLVHVHIDDQPITGQTPAAAQISIYDPNGNKCGFHSYSGSGGYPPNRDLSIDCWGPLSNGDILAFKVCYDRSIYSGNSLEISGIEGGSSNWNTLPGVYPAGSIGRSDR